MNMVEIKNVTKKYQNGTVALKDISISIKQGEFTAIMGPSGSGKSTLMNIIGLMDQPTEGEVYLKGIKINDLKDKEASKLRMKTVGFVFQDFLLNPYLSAKDNVIMPMKINNELKNENLVLRAEMLLEKFGIGECKNKLPREMSGGEQQRVAIARAFANEPDIILADEPTGNLDEENEINIFECLKEIAVAGRTVIVISHNDIVKKYADRVIYVRKGKIYEQSDS